MSQFRKTAEAAARKICGQGTCYGAFGCGHSNNKPGYPKIGEGQVCPLSKYNVQPEVNPPPFYMRSRSESEASLNEIYALCVECEHAVVEPDGSVRRIEFYEFCIDCPAKAVEDSIQEQNAEGGCS